MRTYLYIRCPFASSEAALNSIKGCRYVADAKRGHGAELWFDDAVMPQDYPAKVALVTPLTGGVLQVAPIVDDGGKLRDLLKSSGAVEVYASAKESAAAQPAVADALYPRRAKLDAEGKPTGTTEKVPGAVLQVAACLAGDDPVKAADPSKVEAEPLVEDLGDLGGAIK